MKKEVNYNYIEVPMNLFYLLDGNTSRVLTCLIQSSSFFAKEDGFFFLTKEHICSLLGMSINVLTAALDTLYINSLIAISTVGKGKGKYVNHYRVNFEEFGRFENMNFNDLTNPENKIETVKYKNNYKPQYIKDYEVSKQPCNQVCKQPCKKVITNITNISNIDNKNNINNKENINNILKEKENTITNSNSIKEKEITTVEIIEDMEKNSKNIVEEIVSPANNGGYVLSSILVDWTGENVNEKKNNTTPTTGKSMEELERMMEEVIATSTGREEEASNFKMWVKLNKNDLNSAGLTGRAEEVFEILKNASNKAILEPQTHQVGQESTSRGDALKTPKNSRYEQARKRTPSLPKCEVVDGQEYVCLECGERIPVRSAWEQEDRELEEIFMEMANAC